MRPEARHDRTRLDLMWWKGKLGLRGPSRPEGGFAFEELKDPETPSTTILEMMAMVRLDAPPLEMAQLRFRSGPNREAGLWIDTANEAIRDLLREGDWLKRQLARGWAVEIGQKRKEVSFEGEELHLIPARARVWLPSTDVNGNDVPLRSLIALFAQPGPEANRALFAVGFELLDECGIGRLAWREWGAGYGNLTVGYASRLGDSGLATEFEAPAAELLVENCRDFCPGVSARQEAAERSAFGQDDHELWLLDPPRPGFGALLRRLPELERTPKWILNYHCHETGLREDAKLLRDAGYHLQGWSAVDAFPGTPHLEAVSIWSR